MDLPGGAYQTPPCCLARGICTAVLDSLGGPLGDCKVAYGKKGGGQEGATGSHYGQLWKVSVTNRGLSWVINRDTLEYCNLLIKTFILQFVQNHLKYATEHKMLIQLFRLCRPLRLGFSFLFCSWGVGDGKGSQTQRKNKTLVGVYEGL